MNILISFTFFRGKDIYPTNSCLVFEPKELMGINLMKHFSTLERLVEVKMNEKSEEKNLHTFLVTDIQIVY